MGDLKEVLLHYWCFRKPNGADYVGDRFDVIIVEAGAGGRQYFAGMRGLLIEEGMSQGENMTGDADGHTGKIIPALPRSTAKEG